MDSFTGACVSPPPADPVVAPGGGGGGGGGAGNGTETAKLGVVQILSQQNDCSDWLNKAADQMSGGILGSAAQIFDSTPLLLEVTDTNSMARTKQGSINYPILVNLNGAFFPGHGSGTPIGGVYQPGSTPAQITILLHEMAHKLNAIPRDSVSSSQSIENTKTVLQHCEAAINGD